MADDGDFKSRIALITFGSLLGAAGLGIVSPGLKDTVLAGINKYFDLHLYLDIPPWAGALFLVVAVAFLFMAFIGQSRIERAVSRVSGAQVSTVGTFLVVKHIGFTPAVRDIQREELPTDLFRRDLRHLLIDLSPDLLMSPPLIESALAKQLRMPDQITAILGINPGVDLAYCGIVQAPFQVLAGYQLSTWARLRLFEWHRHEHRWIVLQSGFGKDLGVTMRTCPVGKGGDIAITVEISYEISESEVVASIPNVGQIVKVKVATPILDCITHQGQVEKIARQFRAALDGTRNLAPGSRVHICCAAPMSVGIALGRMISRTLHPPALAYAYDRTTAKPYAWGIQINGTPGFGQVVRN